jgi:hypothetical protein
MKKFSHSQGLNLGDGSKCGGGDFQQVLFFDAPRGIHVCSGYQIQEASDRQRL